MKSSPFRQYRTELILFAFALVIYSLGIGWGLPNATAAERIHPWGPDEIAPLGFGELYFVFLAPEPRFDPRYPLLFFMIQAATIAPYLLLQWATGGLVEFSAEFPHGLTRPESQIMVMTLLGRLPSLLMASGMVVLAYHTGRALWDRKVALLTALMAFAIYPLFYYARTSNVEVAALFFVSLGLYVYARCLVESVTVRRLAWLCIWAALATATKDSYYAIFLVAIPVVLVLHFMRQRRTNGSIRDWLAAPIIGLLAGLLTYLIASGLIFHPGRYIEHVKFIIEGSEKSKLIGGYYSIPATLDGYLLLLWQCVRFTAAAMGEPTFVLAIVGLILCIRDSWKKALMILPVVGPIVGYIVPVRFVELRFMIAPAYIMVLFAAYGAIFLLVNSNALVKQCARSLIVLAIGWSLINGLNLTYEMLFDSRYTVGRWLQEHVEDGDVVATADVFSPWRLPAVDGDVNLRLLTDGEIVVTRLPADKPEYIILVPLLRGETEHEAFIAPDVYAGLVNGSLGYQRVLHVKTQSLLPRYLVTFVNPVVSVFARDDVVARLDSR